MGEYANVKSRQFIRLLKWLQRTKGIECCDGGRHNFKVKVIHTGKTYPIPSSHREINKRIVKAFMEWLVEQDVCTKEEFDRHI